MPTRRERAVDWLLLHLPGPVLLNPERVAIKSACALIGLTALLFIRPTSISALLPSWVVYVWGATWFLGGVFELLGYWRSVRAVEAAGHRLIILGSLVYGVAIAQRVGLPGYPTVVIIAFIAACSGVRLLIAAGSRLSRQRRR